MRKPKFGFAGGLYPYLPEASCHQLMNWRRWVFCGYLPSIYGKKGDPRMFPSLVTHLGGFEACGRGWRVDIFHHFSLTISARKASFVNQLSGAQPSLWRWRPALCHAYEEEASGLAASFCYCSIFVKYCAHMLVVSVFSYLHQTMGCYLLQSEDRSSHLHRLEDVYAALRRVGWVLRHGFCGFHGLRSLF